jgi:hypothetical protein
MSVLSFAQCVSFCSLSQLLCGLETLACFYLLVWHPVPFFVMCRSYLSIKIGFTSIKKKEKKRDLSKICGLINSRELLLSRILIQYAFL